ncbi:Imm51 family immunity protein [Propionibacterium australiense]|uniref:Immunity protein 51 n=1 Tax=Propionibacterium australiense TaxID=119981 RepID=A0A383SBS3_9ACTN|nr:Imm51 family immunity protein [Propionibacterium australiense]SYZ34676.1 Immunity protein 51 [Propionibacterium australiense]VEH89195.1 Uncharacterised protein [Propionibacterium australiense]
MVVRFGEGDWFGLPVKGGGWALGVIARRRPRSSALLGYFFGPRRPEPPVLADAEGLTAEDAVFVCIFGYLGFKKEQWLVLGKLEGWDRDAWPMPVFIQATKGSIRASRIYYDQDDPAKEIRRELIRPGEPADGPESGSFGHVAVSIRLGNLLPGVGRWPDVVEYPPPRQVPTGLVARLSSPDPDAGDDQGCLTIQAGACLKEVFATRADEGAEGSGYDWAALTRVLIDERAPELVDLVELDPDAQELLVFSTDMKALKKLKILLEQLANDPSQARSLFSRAELE